MLLRLFPCPAVAVWLGVGLCLLVGTVQAQDRIVFKDRHVQEGKITGVNAGSVIMNVPGANGATGVMGFNLALIDHIEAAPPPAVTAGLAASAAGDWDKALAALKPAVDQFRGLPTEWMWQATVALADVYLEKNDPAKADAVFHDLGTLYPAGGSRTLSLTLGQARLAFARNDLPHAQAQLTQLREAALKHPAETTRGDGAVYGQVCFLLGQIEERQNNYSAALQDYLRTVTLFYEDAPVTVRAQKSADALRAAHKDVSVP